MLASPSPGEDRDLPAGRHGPGGFRAGSAVNNVQSYAKTGKIAVTKWNAQASRFDTASGIVPVPPDWHAALGLDFVTYKGDAADPRTDPKGWTFLKSGIDPRQMLFAQPLTQEQIEKLKRNYGK